MEVIVFIVGLLMGSFYNVVGIRLPEKKSIIKPRSHCIKCGHVLNWYENIPIISYLFLMGKCRKCKQSFSIMYPAMELFTGVLFLISYMLFGLSENFYLSLIIASLVVLIFITDSIYMIILDEALIVSGVLILIIKFIYQGFMPALISLGHGMIIFLVIYALMILGNYLFKKESMGGGDIKLSFIAGMVLGPYLGFFYIVFASFLAFPYAIYVVIKNDDGILPFGPFLATSMLFCFYNSEMLTQFLNRLFIIN